MLRYFLHNKIELYIEKISELVKYIHSILKQRENQNKNNFKDILLIFLYEFLNPSPDGKFINVANKNFSEDKISMITSYNIILQYINYSDWDYPKIKEIKQRY